MTSSTITPDADDQALSGAAQIAGEPTVQLEQGDNTSPDDDLGEDDNGEAAKFRRRMHDAETERDALRTERDTLAGRVETMQRAEVERLAGTDYNLRVAAGVWGAGAQLADLLDDTGTVDPLKVKDAAETAMHRLGLAKKHELKPDRSQGYRGSPASSSSNPWAAALNPSTRAY